MIPKLTFLVALTCFASFFIYKTFYKEQLPEKKISTTIDIKKEHNIKEPEVILNNFKLQQVNKDKKENWILTATNGKIFHYSNQVECENLKCIFTKDNKIIANLNSKNGFVDQDKKEANLLGDVFGNFHDLQIKGKNIQYDFENHIIKTKDKTFYKHPRFTMLTNSSITDVKKNRITIENGIETEFYLK